MMRELDFRAYILPLTSNPVDRQVFGAPCILDSIVTSNATGGTFTFFDSTSPGGNIIWQGPVGSFLNVHGLFVRLATGLWFTTPGGGAPSGWSFVLAPL